MHIKKPIGKVFNYLINMQRKYIYKENVRLLLAYLPVSHPERAVTGHHQQKQINRILFQ